MKIILIVFLSFLTFACSGDVDEKRKKSTPAENKAPAVNLPNSQSLQPDLHISGGEQTHISGAPSSSHISGQ